MSDPLLTVQDVAHVLQCSENSVIRRFAKLDGVIDMGRATLGVRRYRVLRIPKSVVERYLVSQQPKGNRRTVEIGRRAPTADASRRSGKTRRYSTSRRRACKISATSRRSTNESRIAPAC